MSLCVRKNGRIPPTNINSPWLDFFAFTIFFFNYYFMNSKELVAEKHAKNCTILVLKYSFLLFCI